MPTATTDPLSLTEAKRLANSADTLLLRATRPADLETPIGAFLRLDDGTTPAYLLESVEGGERLGRYSFLGIGPRRLLEVRDGRSTITTRPLSEDAFLPDLPRDDPRRRRSVAALRDFTGRRKVLPTEGMPRFTGGAVGALAYDAMASFEPTVPLPERDPVGVPTAAFIESDLVLVFDHLTHTLSAIASLHTDAPDLEGRYRIAERAVFEALERTARPSAAELGTGSAANGSAQPIREERIETSLGRDAYIHAVKVAKDAIAAGEAIQVVLARRQTLDLPPAGDGQTLDGIGLYRALRRVNPSPYLFFVRVPSYEVVGASPELLLQVVGDRLTTHPIAGTRPRGADEREDALLGDQLQRDPKERAEHVMLVDLGRNDLGRVARPGTVTVSKYMEVERYSHVLHLVEPRGGQAPARARRARCASVRLPRRHAERRTQGPCDAADLRRRRRAARAVRWRRGLPRLRRQPRHGDHHPERRAEGRPGAHPHGRGHRRRQRPRIGIRRDRAQGSSASAGDRARERDHVRERSRDPGRRRGGRDRAGRCRVILVVDNYDSFTFNLVQALEAAGADVQVVRNDALDRGWTRAMADDGDSELRGIVVSPGPSDPDHAGVSVDAVKVAAERRIPLLGVCLGMQSMAAAFGATIVRAPTLVHGEASEVTHDGAGLLSGMPPSFMAARYHSLCVDPATLPPEHRGDRHERGRPRRDGHPAHGAAARRRPVPPRVGADAAGSTPAGELPAARRGGPRRATRRGERLVRDPWAGRGTPTAPTPSGEPANPPSPACRRARRAHRIRRARRSRPMSDAVRAALATIVDGGTLSVDDARLAMGAVMDGEATPSQLAALLMGLRMRGETVEELAGFATAMRERVLQVPAPEGTIDVVGTGGDGERTFNISTTSALVVAAAGVPVAKHGNRAITSKAGSADVLDALGVRIDHDADVCRGVALDARLRVPLRARVSIRR